MVNQILLNEKFTAAGLKKSFVAQCCGLTSQGFRNCVSGKSSFRVTHVKIMMNLLSLTPDEVIDIFFN